MKDTPKMKRGLIALLTVLAVTVSAAVEAAELSHESSWEDCPDRVWVGAEYWANPHQDWRVRDGRLECMKAAPEKGRGSVDRNVHLLTIQPGPQSDFTMRVTLGRIRPQVRGWAGFRFGHHGGIDDYRHSCIYGQGISAGLRTNGELFIGDKVVKAPFSEAAMLELSMSPMGEGKHGVRLTLRNADGSDVKSVQTTVDSDKVDGNLLLVSHGYGKDRDGQFWFRDWHVKGGGDDLRGGPEQAWGPILWTQYTLSRKVLKLTAQMVPLSSQDNRTVDLQLKRDGDWQTIGTETIDPLSRTATFRVPEWDDSRDTSYRAVYKLKTRDGKESERTWAGTIRKDPREKDEIAVAGFTGNKDYVFPNTPIIEKLEKLDPDVLFFSGDQIYEDVARYGIIRTPVEPAALDYLRKWYLVGWSFGDLMRDRPVVHLPDDHDVYQGNIWGQGGRALPKRPNGKRVFADGGYMMDPDWVNAVQRTQCAHLPDPVDPPPIEQGITVYFTDMVYGNVSFAIIEDRKFKWGPLGKEAETNPENAVLLGERQLRFLENWATDWKGASLKCVLSQTVFAQCHTLMGPRKVSAKENDANAWPKHGRNRALREIRKAFAFMYAGDNHLPSLVQHGIDEHRDAGFSFTVPSIAAGFPRAWLPETPGQNREPGAPDYTGDNLDMHGNRLTMWAAANPVVWGPKEGDLDIMDKKSSGFGLVRFNTDKQTYTIECWRLLGELDDPETGQFEGWPKTISVRDNYARTPFGWLPAVEPGFADPVVQVVNDKTGELVYAMRVKGKRFTPWVFEPGIYTVRALHPETGKERVLKEQAVSKRNIESQPVITGCTYDSRHGNNIFTTETPVSMSFTASADGQASYSLVDSIGGAPKKLRAEFIDRQWTCEPGYLPVGYYTISTDRDEHVCSFAVLPASYSNSEDTAFCVDMAVAWKKITTGEDYRTWYPKTIGSLAMAGMRSARERSWMFGDDASFDLTTPPDTRSAVERLEFLYGVYKQNKIRVITSYHSLPGWARSAMPSVPRDLGDIYKMQTTYSARFKDHISAWEIWNEIDLHEFYKGTAYHYAALLKTAYLASKDVAPNTLVSLSSLALSPNEMSHAVFDNGISSYFDVYNYHSYGKATMHADIAGNRIEYFYSKCGVRPVWKTETGVTRRDHKHFDDTGRDTPGDMRRGGIFLVRSMVDTTSIGISRTYWFLGAPGKRWPHMGFIDANGNATRLLSVFATMNRLLEDGDYAGSHTPQKDLYVHVYNTTDGQTAAIWSDGGATTVELSVEGDAAVHAMSGEVIKQHKGVRTVPVSIEDEPVFVTATSFRLDLKPRNPKLSTYPASTMASPSRIVIDPFFENEREAYDIHQHMLSVAPGETIKGTLKVHNFSDATFRGNLKAEVDGRGWRVVVDDPALTIGPREHQELPVAVSAPAKADAFSIATLRLSTDSGRSLSSVRLGVDRKSLPPSKTLDLSDTNWTESSPGDCATSELRLDGGRAIVAVASTKIGNIHQNVLLQQSGGFDLSEYDAIRVTIDFEKVSGPASLDLRCWEPNGAGYGRVAQDIPEPGQYVFYYFFSDMRWFPGTTNDGPDFHLNKESIARLAFLIGPKDKKKTHEYRYVIEKIEALKW